MKKNKTPYVITSLLVLAFAGPIMGQRASINEEILAQLIQEKQQEIKARWLANLVRGSIHTTNHISVGNS